MSNVPARLRQGRAVLVGLLVLAAVLLGSRPAEAVTACGEANQRACCGVPACSEGTFQMPGCAGDCWCDGMQIVKSAGTCIEASPCGGRGQRVCWDIEFWGDPEEWPANPQPNWSLPLNQRGCGLDDVTGVQLEAVDGCSGDCFIRDPNGFGRTSQRTCANLTDNSADTSVPGKWANEPETGFRNPQPNSCSMRGFTDMHVHMFGHLAHGEALFSGKPYDETNSITQPKGINLALRPDYATDRSVTGPDGELTWPHVCPPYLGGSDSNDPWCGERVWHGDHTLFDTILGYGTGDAPHSNFGAPMFIGFPHWKSTIHQQVYYKWLKRAWHGGLRMMTMLAVSNEAACKASIRIAGQNCDEQMQSVVEGQPYDPTSPIDNQLDAAYAFEAWLDAQSGGPGKGWFRIVKTPLEARQAILRGKLAVVLGIEVDNLFNCRERTGVWRGVLDWNVSPLEGLGYSNLGGVDHPACTEESVKAAVKHYYDKGVRHWFPIHNNDNAFGAAATWSDGIAAGNAISENRWFETVDCNTTDLATGFEDSIEYGFWLNHLKINTSKELGFLTYWWPNEIYSPLYPLGRPDWDYGASCNARGLHMDGTGPQDRLGRILLDELMDYGMLIDIDHMSVKSLDDTLRIASSRNYPVVASHVLPYDMSYE